MSSRPEVDGGPLLANGAGIAPAKRFPMELSPVSTPAGPGWIGMSGGAVAWLSLGELDEAKAAAYWKGPVKKVKTCPLSAADLETVARGDPVLTLRPVGTAFQFKVWQQLTGIEFATTSTYSTIAAKLGSPARARAVGAAVGANPIAW
ncbi:MAG: MGMT family protein, partial [Oceanipulchritudo sp.]